MQSTKSNLRVLFEDNHLIVINKRIGDIVQGDITGDKPLSEVVKEYIAEKYDKPGKTFLGVVHRLDRPTTGIVVFAKTSMPLMLLAESCYTNILVVTNIDLNLSFIEIAAELMLP